MTANKLKACLFVFVTITILCFAAKAQAQTDQQHTLVVMRTIGHRVLLTTGDSTSQVLPVKKTGNNYVISFGSDFVFNPISLATTIDSVMRESNLSQSYIVEMVECSTDALVYSYEIKGLLNTDLIPCATRIPSRDCYELHITLLDLNTVVNSAPSESNRASTVAIVLAGLLAIGGIVFIHSKKKQSIPTDPNAVNIGKYVVDKRNMALLYGNQKVELTGKETDLLLLLHSAVNSTLERKEILRSVWGDDGDYIGRTLDVFISKLRKKLEADPTIKIANIRGIGYKLVVNER